MTYFVAWDLTVDPGSRYPGEKCPAYLEYGRAEKIRTTKGAKGYCDRCLRRRGEEATKDLEARRAGKLR